MKVFKTALNLGVHIGQPEMVCVYVWCKCLCVCVCVFMCLLSMYVCVCMSVYSVCTCMCTCMSVVFVCCVHLGLRSAPSRGSKKFSHQDTKHTHFIRSISYVNPFMVTLWMWLNHWRSSISCTYMVSGHTSQCLHLFLIMSNNYN
jgi:hypothetical protein